MTSIKPAALVQYFDTLLAPREAADLPHWLAQASAQDRRRLQTHHSLGHQARRRATQAFAAVQSLYHYHRMALADDDAFNITPQRLLRLHQQQAADTRYQDELSAQLQLPALHTAKQDGYLATLREECTLAAIRGRLDKHGRQTLEWFLEAFDAGSTEFPQTSPSIDKHPRFCASLQLLDDLPVPDIILFGAAADDATCVAFIPGHPEHPVKQYATRAAFFASLRRELRDADFQRFFSRFIALRHQHRALVGWADRDALLTLAMQTIPLKTGLRAFIVEQMQTRLLEDARFLQPTDAGQARLLSTLYPGYSTALQAHVQLGAGAGLASGEEHEGKAPSDWLAPLRGVKRAADGRRQRWVVDLSGYRLDPAESPTTAPDAQGIHTLGAHKIIAINQAFYRIEKNTQGHWQIAHPTAAGVYLPLLRSNGAGAWHHSLEQPQQWSRLALLRRLGPLTGDFDDARLLQLARIADVSNSQLRAVYLDDQAVPSLLIHVLQRGRIQDQVAQVITRIANGLPVDKSDQVAQLKAFYRAVDACHGRSAPSRTRRGGDIPGTSADDHCTPPPQDLFSLWLPRLSRAIAMHRYELAQLDTDQAVEELHRRYPDMPLSVAQRFLDSNRAYVYGQAQTLGDPLPLPIAQAAQSLAEDARLAHALEGFALPWSINQDTFILAIRLLQHMDGWQPGTALLLRSGERFGTPLAELGLTDVETTSIYLDDEEGWSTSTATQVLLAQDMTEYGFYRAILYALPERQRRLLGLGLNEPERLHQQLRDMALARPTRARLLLGLPLARSWLTPTATHAVRRAPLPADAELFDREPVQRRIERLLTQHSLTLPSQGAQAFINHLLRNNEPIGPRVAALEQERVQLDSALDGWIAESPGTLTRQLRSHAAAQVLHAWESHLFSRQDGLEFARTDLDGLPPLPVTLPEVLSLRLIDIQQLQNLPTLLQRLPNLRRLEIINAPLTELPATLTTLQSLRTVNLSRTRLTPASLGQLGELRNLRNLIINDNTADAAWTAHHMTRLTASGSLQMLTIESSRATFGPGVFRVLADLTELWTLNLSRNLISLREADVSDLAELRQLRLLDLSNNPLTRMPDVTHLRHLEEIDLSYLHGAIDQWPRGLEQLPLLQAADLRFVPLASVPTGAGRVRGLRLSSANLPTALREQFQAEMRAVGNHRSDSEDSMGEFSDSSVDSDIAAALTAAVRDENTLRDAPRLFEGMSEADQAQATQLLVADSSALMEFFSLLLRIDNSRDAQRPQARMRSRIQAMIRGAFNADLGRALLEQARKAVTCVDRDALVFSQMENLLHADTALTKASGADAVAELIALGTSDWRVIRLREHVTSQITGWRLQGHVIDYAEIELYFRIALATRLGLRDQPQDQVFTAYTRWVTEAMLEAAHQEVLRPQSELLPGYLNVQPYWESYLDFAYAPQVATINHWRERIGQVLDAAATPADQADELPVELDTGERQRLQRILVEIGLIGPLQPLPAVLELNFGQYRAAYEALLKQVEQARLVLTQAILAPQPGPSSRN